MNGNEFMSRLCSIQPNNASCVLRCPLVQRNDDETNHDAASYYEKREKASLAIKVFSEAVLCPGGAVAATLEC